MDKVNKIANRYYWVSALFETARMGIGATSVMFMLRHGIVLADIAIIKIIQSTALLLFEIPTGIFADRFGRKISILLSAVCSLASLITYVSGSGLFPFILADLFNAMAICFWSGAFDAHAVATFDRHKVSRDFLGTFFSRVVSFDSVGVMLGGLAGGLLAEHNELYPFYFSIVVEILCIGSLFFFIESDRGGRVRPVMLGQEFVPATKRAFQSFFHEIGTLFKQCLGSDLLRMFVAIQLLLQVLLQPILHYWQPYFTSLSSGVTAPTLGKIFFLYVGAQSLISYLGSLLLKSRPTWLAALIVSEAMVLPLLALTLPVSHRLESAVAVFVVLQGGLGHLRGLLGASLNQRLEATRRASVLSFVSFVSRFGMIASLCLIGQAVQFVPVSNLFYLSSGAAFIVAVVIVHWVRKSAQVSRVVI